MALGMVFLTYSITYVLRKKLITTGAQKKPITTNAMIYRFRL